MYVLGSSLPKLPVISLRDGQVLAACGRPIIKRDDLEVVAVFCQSGGWQKANNVIMMRDIREIAREGIVIDSFEDIEDANEIVRLKSVIDENFTPLGKTVVTELGQTLGKVEDFTIDVRSKHIQKLYIKQSLIKNMLLNNLVIDRNQITDISHKKITVRDATLPEPKLGSVVAPRPTPEA